MKIEIGKQLITEKNYERKKNIGDVGDRTPDLPHAKRALYH